jgi:hypothetical protein
MTDNLNRLFEVDAAERQVAPKAAGVTLFARFCQAFGWLTLFSAALFFVPGKRAGTTPFDPTVPELFSLLGLVMFCPLTVLTALGALIRIRLTHNRYTGGGQVAVGLGLAVSAVVVFALCIVG